ncbi:Eco57I restriction-modification methylase domain-containing protein [Streptomyces meridianus]|uniref:site-specific DNA-methyltransferase (adenine-specific) n=1 Tax=Streptomyces meridianus TaxID=2938945 RepID=A0ABT0XDE6_9ACTN|nr:DNA methyltransferase [Streptomyces meridianus]MCM2580541.1 N-6 DNA methylase [Streptomyces meridianus]
MSATARNQVFSAVHTIGGLIPADMLVRISEGRDVPGAGPADYGLPSSRSVRDEAERSWEYLKPLWRDLRGRLPEDPVTGAPAGDPTGLAGSDWLAPLWRELGFGRLTAMGRSGVVADSDPDKLFGVSHRWSHVLVHQTPWNADLDRRPGGAGTVPPQSMLQECLNRTEAHLWGTLTNGRQVRLLRDSSALATASYVEFDLEAIFDGELFSEFVLLYRLLHVSRFEVGEDAAPSACRLEKWRTEAIASGTRALDQLRKGVQSAITMLGTGFLRHPANRELRETLDVTTFHTALLRLVYRLLFLFVAEDREVLLKPDAEARATKRYAAYFSTARLRRHAQRRRGTSHGDLYEALRFVLTALGNDDGCPDLGLPALGGLFDETETDKVLHGLALSNEPLLGAVRALSVVRDTGSRRNRVIDYRHLDAEELGSIYESLLELVPRHSATDRTFELVELAGNTRKTTGSYYTPSSLIDCLLDSALDPVIDDAVKRGEIRATRSGRPDAGPAIVEELLNLTVCDPACGSGHFLVAAARRIAKRVAAVREQNPEPTIDAVRHALHEVVARCVYGVDLNPMAVELAKVSLWLEALEPGKPLGFLDAHIKHGNALLGTTPALLAGGIPDDAFKPIEGDDKKITTALKKRNAAERGGQLSFTTDERIWFSNTAFATTAREITTSRADTLRDVRLQSSRFRGLETDAEYLRALNVADAWCAAFVWPKVQGAPTPVTEGVFRDLQNPGGGIPAATRDEIALLAGQYKFFHWHLEFPEVFHVPAKPDADVDTSVGWAGGFSCVLGNPPWERIKLQEQEFFAQRDQAIATAPNAAARKRLIAELPTENPELFADFTAAKRRAEGESQFLRSSLRYPLTGRGDINTYAVFAETDRNLIGPTGRTGVIVPTGISTDATTQFFFKDLVQQGSLASLYDFENRSGLFPAVDSRMKFSLLTLAGRTVREPAANFAFFLHDPAELDAADKRFTLTPEEISLLNPNTGTCPIFRTRRDAEISLSVQRRGHLLRSNNLHVPSLGVRVRRIYDLGKTEGLNLCTHVAEERSNGPRMYEGKLFHAFDHRNSSYNPSGNTSTFTISREPDFRTSTRYHLTSEQRLSEDLGSWKHPWLIGFRDIARSTDERTMIAAILPRVATDYTIRVILPPQHDSWLLIGNLNSFAFDYLYRLRLGGTHLSDFITYQLPAIPWDTYTHARINGAPIRDWLAPRLIELIYTADDMTPFAVDTGDTGMPFRWVEERRAVIRAELDALFFHLYGIARDDVDYILETFPIVKRKDEAKYGSYRTKELILDLYDRMAAAGVSLDTPLVDGENFTSDLTPPPGHGPRHPAQPSSA